MPTSLHNNLYLNTKIIAMLQFNYRTINHKLTKYAHEINVTSDRP